MNVWAFILFATVFSALVAAHFAAACRSWRATRGEEPSDIEPEYVRLEDYFGRSFRVRVSEWLELPPVTALPDGTRVLRKEGEKIRVSAAAEFAPYSVSDEILVVQGAFRGGAGCVFRREILAHGTARIGAGSRLQAVASDGDLFLGAGSRVARWVDCRGAMEIGPQCTVRSRATAGAVIRLRKGARIASAFAPTVLSAFDGRDPEVAEEKLPEPEQEFPLPDPAAADRRRRAKLGLDPALLAQLGPDGGLYRGDWKPSAPLRLRVKMVVKGDCAFPAGSLLEADLKADGNVDIGAGSACLGNIVAGGNVRFGRGCRFYGVVHAGGRLHLEAGVRGGRPEAWAAAYSADELTVDDGVIVHGKLASGTFVLAGAETKRRRRKDS